MNPQWRHAPQDLYDLPLSRFKSFDTEKGEVLVYDNANLSVMITDKCNADCNFCVAHLRYLTDGHQYIKPLVSNDSLYLKALAYNLEKAVPFATSLSLTGGEPSVNKRLPAILELLEAYPTLRKTMTTNGTGLLNQIGSKTLVERLAQEDQLTFLNISRAHYDFHKNNRLMVMADHLLPERDLVRAIAIAREAGTRVRLSCTLLQEGISSVAQMRRYLDWAASIGVDNVVFRQLMAFDNTRVTPGRIPSYCKSQTVPLHPIWESLDASEDFEKYHQVLGYYYYVEVFKYKGMDVVTEIADLRKIDAQVSRFSQKFDKPVVFELVAHPNGTLGGSWREFERILFEKGLD